jgi:hypothetical protein
MCDNAVFVRGIHMSRQSMRVQCQLNHSDVVPSITESSDEITNQEAVAVVEKFEALCKGDSNFKKDEAQRGLESAFKKIYQYLAGVAGSGAKPSGNGNVARGTFTFKNEEYRIDLEAFGGTKDAVFFK